MTTPQADDTPLYFAYGSNLNAADWARYCAGIGAAPEQMQAVAPAVLPDMQLCFDYHAHSRGGGALDLRPQRGQLVHGMLFRVSAQGWAALDRKEGAPHGYRRVRRVALMADGSRVEVLTYEVCDAMRQDFCPPTADYERIVAEGLQAWGLPVDGLADAVADRAPRGGIAHLFVYGTLLRGEANAGLIPAASIRAVQPAWVAGSLYDTGQGYPALKWQAGSQRRVRGECLHLADLPELLPALDELEGFGGYDDPAPLYHRTLITLQPENGEPCRAWCYIGAREAMFRVAIEQGCWRTHRGRGSLAG